MKTKLLALCTITAFTLSPLAHAADASATDKKTDQEVLGTLVTLDKNEIAAADYVLKQSVAPGVKDFATMMTKDHGDNVKQATKMSKKLGGSPIVNADAKTLKAQGKDELDALKKLKGKELEVTYINDMVKDHKDALETIDGSLLKNASNPDLKKMLEATREHVQHHLEVATDLQSKMG
jgi:putative membrane protein